MKHIKKFNEVNYYLDLSESIRVLHDICYELKDEGIDYNIQPDNEIKVKMLSMVLNNKIEKRDIDFYLEIDTVNEKLINSEWFIETLQRVEDYMSDIGFNTQYSANYYSGKIIKKDVKSIYDITKTKGVIKSIRLDFKFGTVK